MVILDTHVLVWWVNGGNNLSVAAHKAIKISLESGSEVIISSQSTWEIVMLIEKGRLVLSMDITSWIEEVTQIEGVRFEPMDNEVAIKSTALPGDFSKDPADRMIVATARKLAIPLITADEKIINYEHVKAIW